MISKGFPSLLPVVLNQKSLIHFKPDPVRPSDLKQNYLPLYRFLNISPSIYKDFCEGVTDRVSATIILVKFGEVYSFLPFFVDYIQSPYSLT